MTKILNFFVNTQKGKNLFQLICILSGISFIVGTLLMTPSIWMGSEYHETWMNTASLYSFYPFVSIGALFVFFFAPYMWYVSTSLNYKGDKTVLKTMAIICSMVPGGIIYGYIAKSLEIPGGAYALIGIFAFGMVYLLIMKMILRKPFTTAQNFIPLM